MPSSEIRVAICTPLYNHREITDRFVRNIIATTQTNINWKLFLLDNGSTDDTAHWLRTSIPDMNRVKAVFSDENLGFGGGNDKLADVARSTFQPDYYIFLSNDVMVECPDWIDRLVETIKDFEDKAIAGPHVVVDNMLTAERGIPITYVAGWCMAMPVEAFYKVGGFGSEFGAGFFEDVWLSYRLAKAGYRLVDIGNDGYHHLGSQTIGDGSFDISALTAKNQGIFFNLIDQARTAGPKINGKNRIVIYCPGNYRFNDGDYEGKGVGGAEATLILMTRALAKLGWRVDVYNNPSKAGQFSGVNYHSLDSFRYSDEADIFVLFRSSMPLLSRVNAKVKVFWSCDQYTSNDWHEMILPFVDRIFCISPYHTDHLISHYHINPNNIFTTSCCINEADYVDSEIRKIPGKLLYCSVPRRGLEHLLRYFPKIKEKVPHAELYITSDYRLWGTVPDDTEFREMFANQEGVHYLGKISRGELVRHQLESEVMAYPCTYEECFCISAAECQAAGAVPVITDIGAISTTVLSGVIIRKQPGTAPYEELFVENVIKLLTEPGFAETLRSLGIKGVLNTYGSEVVAQSWSSEFKRLLRIHAKLDPQNSKEPTQVDFDEFKKKITHQMRTRIEFAQSTLIIINGERYEGKEVLIPMDQVGEVKRMITERYGSEHIISIDN